LIGVGTDPDTLRDSSASEWPLRKGCTHDLDAGRPLGKVVSDLGRHSGDVAGVGDDHAPSLFTSSFSTLFPHLVHERSSRYASL
jgi:hypothetical protein